MFGSKVPIVPIVPGIILEYFGSSSSKMPFGSRLVSVLTAERENVYKSRPAVSLERAQEVAQKFMEDVRSKRNRREKRLEMIRTQKEDKDTGKTD